MDPKTRRTHQSDSKYPRDLMKRAEAITCVEIGTNSRSSIVWDVSMHAAISENV